MREIKFRAKRIDNNKWAYGGLVQADDYCIIDQQNELYVEREYNLEVILTSFNCLELCAMKQL